MYVNNFDIFIMKILVRHWKKKKILFFISGCKKKRTPFQFCENLSHLTAKAKL